MGPNEMTCPNTCVCLRSTDVWPPARDASKVHSPTLDKVAATGCLARQAVRDVNLGRNGWENVTVSEQS